MVDIPKNPKAEDLVSILVRLDERLTAIEEYVGKRREYRPPIASLRSPKSEPPSV